MKQFHSAVLGTCVLLSSVFGFSAFAQGTAFTYQGRLNSGGGSANGSYDLSFTLFNTNSSGTAIAGPVTNAAVSVSNGLFMTTVDFGAGAFTGTSNWLEIAVSTNGANAFSTLAPRQPVTPVPYAIFATTAGSLGGTLPASQLTSIGNTNGGNNNFFTGQSGNATMSGDYNTAGGVQALLSNTSGTNNLANGYQALFSNTSGSDNATYGVQALYANTSGGQNAAYGSYALYSNIDGSYNASVGYASLYSNTNGSYNTAIGTEALAFNTTGSNNVALGNFAGGDNVTGSYNIDIGNSGYSGDTNVTRIGDVQTKAYIAGTIIGDGSGLTKLPSYAVTNTQSGVTLSGTFNGAFSGNGSSLTNVPRSGYAQYFSLNASPVVVAAGATIPLVFAGIVSGWTYNGGNQSLSPTSAGTYMIEFEGLTSTASYTVGMKYNGAGILSNSEVVGTAAEFSRTFLMTLNPGDTLQFYNLGGSSITLTSPGAPYFQVTIVRVN